MAKIIDAHGRLNIEALRAPPADIAQLRRADIPPDTPDDAVIATARAGPLVAAATLGYLSALSAAPCYCCGAFAPADRADAEKRLRAFLRHYDNQFYVRSREFTRAAVTAARDLRPLELAAVRRALAPMSPPAVRVANSRDGICIAAPACRPGIWIFSTPEGRRLMRHLKKRGPVRASVAVDAVPRWRFRVYEVRPADGHPERNLAEEAAGWASKAL